MHGYISLPQGMVEKPLPSCNVLLHPRLAALVVRLTVDFHYVLKAKNDQNHKEATDGRAVCPLSVDRTIDTHSKRSRKSP